MVDALQRACEWLAADGRIIDVHPTAAPARLVIANEVERFVAGELQDFTDGYGPAGRHAQADAAIDSALADGWLVLEGRRTVTFIHETDSLSEMCEHIRSAWRHAVFAAATLERAEARLRQHPGGALLLEEDIGLARLRCGGRQ